LRTIKLLVSYDGTDFSGFQRQANARSVQQELESALEPLEGKHVTVAGAGRTGYIDGEGIDVQEDPVPNLPAPTRKPE